VSERDGRKQEMPQEAREDDRVQRCASLNGYGSYLFGQGRYDEARDTFLEAALLVPDSDTTRRNLAVASSASGLHEEAITILSALVRAHPEDAVLHNAFGLALHRAGRLGAANEEFGRATDLAPTESEYWYHRGTNALAMERTQAAISALARAVALPGAEAPCYFNLAMALGAAGETERATVFLQKAVALHPDDAATLVQAARAMAEWGYIVTAVGSLRSFLDGGHVDVGVKELLSDLSDTAAQHDNDAS
jgi:Flp pilus assembly protein TadD